MRRNPATTVKIIHVDIVQPDIIQVLAADHKQSAAGNRRQMRVSGFRRDRLLLELVRGPGRGHPAVRAQVKEADIAEDEEFVRCVLGLRVDAHAAKDDEVVVPYRK